MYKFKEKIVVHSGWLGYRDGRVQNDGVEAAGRVGSLRGSDISD
jgi:hypothetical protein